MSKTVRSTMVTIHTNSQESQRYVVRGKTQLSNLLFAVAARNWQASMPAGSQLPRSRKAVVDAFFASDTYNSFAVTDVQVLSDDSLNKLITAATKTVDRMSAMAARNAKTEA